MRWLTRLLVVGVLAAGGAWWWAGRAEGPVIEIREPEAFIGHATTLELAVQAPDGHFSRIEISLEQDESVHPLFSLDDPLQATVGQETPDRISIRQPIGRVAVPELQAGDARIVVRASRSVLYGLREAESVAVRDVQVRLEPPRVSVLSHHHYINHGGAEFVVYRVTPPDVESGVRVGNRSYPGYPASAAGLSSDDSMRVAVFALLHDQDLTEPIALYARDPAGNEAVTPFDHRTFLRPFGRTRIQLDDGFLQRVVPAIAATTPDLALSAAPEDLLDSFLRINGDLRRRNNQTIAEQAARTAPRMLWDSAFQPLGRASVESRFADHRTYIYRGEEVDQQVHLGFDLAVTARVPVLAAHHGSVVYASDLGIYGNCVIVDHGLGVQSLYAHLSSIEVAVGDEVEKGQMLGRSGMTGLAGGDHLHFTMLVNGEAVDPIEWWDPQWMQDRVLRKIAEAEAGLNHGS